MHSRCMFVCFSHNGNTVSRHLSWNFNYGRAQEFFGRGFFAQVLSFFVLSLFVTLLWVPCNLYGRHGIYIGTNVCTFLFSMPTLFVMRVFVRLNYTGRERKTYNIMFCLMRDEQMLHQLNTFFFLNSVANITKYGKSLLGMTTKPNSLEGLIIPKVDSNFFPLNCKQELSKAIIIRQLWQWKCQTPLGWENCLEWMPWINNVSQ